MPMTIDNIPGTSTPNKNPPKNYKNNSVKEPSPPPQPIFLKKPTRPIDKSVLAAFLKKTSDEEKKELIQDKADCSGKLWTRCGYCQVYLKVSNVEKHYRKCCAKWGMIVKK